MCHPHARFKRLRLTSTLRPLPFIVMEPYIQMITVGPLATNCYLIGDPRSREAVLVDPGEEAGRILEAVEQGAWRVHSVLLTHAHFDHVLAAGQIVNTLEVPFLVPPGEWELLRRAPEIAEQLLGTAVDPPPEPDGGLQDGVEVKMGSITLTVAETPGHSPASVSLVGEGEVFVGDVLFAGSIGRTDLPGADHATLMRSIEQVLLPLDDDVRVFPGHGPPTTIGRERRTNPFILELLERGGNR